MNKFINGLEQATNFTNTENGGVTHKSTLNKVYDLFAFSGAMRNRTKEDCILLFKNAYEEDPVYALKCLFYLRDIRGGQGERRFFRECLKWFAEYNSMKALTLIPLVAEYGRWDDLFCLIDTPLETKMFNFLYQQFKIDLESKTPSLLGKWLKSENTSSFESRKIAKQTRKAFGLTARTYRKYLSELRKRINIVERLMSANEWDKIEFDKIPSKAGLIYKNAFARRDIIKEKYKAFAKDKNTKVNAKALYPYNVVDQALKYTEILDDDAKTSRNMINKYWDNLNDYFNGKSLNGICVCDTSASMHGTPMNVAISLSLYCAEKNSGPLKDYFITFSSYPKLVKTEGIDFVDKAQRIKYKAIVDDTNIERVFSLILNQAVANNWKQEDIPETVIIISDMEFNACTEMHVSDAQTEMEAIEETWNRNGFKMPRLIFWNVDARQENIPMKDNGKVTFVSGFSPVIFEQVIENKNGLDLMYDILNNERYAKVQ